MCRANTLVNAERPIPKLINPSLNKGDSYNLTT